MSGASRFRGGGPNGDRRRIVGRRRSPWRLQDVPTGINYSARNWRKGCLRLYLHGEGVKISPICFIRIRLLSKYPPHLNEREQLGNKSDAAETRLALAELDCDSGKGAEAEQLSRTAIEAFRADAYADQEIFAQSMLSRSLLQQGKVDEARAAIAEAVRLSKKKPGCNSSNPCDA